VLKCFFPWESLRSYSHVDATGYNRYCSAGILGEFCWSCFLVHMHLGNVRSCLTVIIGSICEVMSIVLYWYSQLTVTWDEAFC